MQETEFSEPNSESLSGGKDCHMGNKREDYISWDEYFMGVAILSGLRSKDPNTQVGCCIVSQDVYKRQVYHSNYMMGSKIMIK